jgi:hypothetical protein
MEAPSWNHCCSGKTISITYSEYVFVALVIQHAVRMRILSSVDCLVLQYFSKLSHKRYDFRKQVTEEKNGNYNHTDRNEEELTC